MTSHNTFFQNDWAWFLRTCLRFWFNVRHKKDFYNIYKDQSSQQIISMVRVSLFVIFAQIVSVLGQTSSSLPTEVPSFDSFIGSYDFFPFDDQTSSPSWSPTGSPTEDGYSGRGLDVDDDVSGEDEEEIVSGSGSLTPSKLACVLALIPATFIFS